MKAIVCTEYGPPSVLQLDERIKPEPKKNEICIKVVASAVTTSDSRVRGFQFPLTNPMILMFRLILGISRPRNPVLGMVMSGVVESVGRNVSKFKPGDEVYGMTGPGFGSYAEYNCVSENGCFVHKPEHLSHEDAAAITYGGLLASDCLQRGKINSGNKVLIYGASGAIGSSAVQLAKASGAHVVAVCSGKNRELVSSLGADEVWDYTSQETVPEGQTFDLVFDAVGDNKTSALKRACRLAVSPKGKYISVDKGMLKSEVTALRHINRLLARGEFRAVIDKTFPLEQIVAAHEYVDLGHKRGNVVVVV